MKAIEHMQNAILQSKAEREEVKSTSTNEVDDGQQAPPADGAQPEHYTGPLEHRTSSGPL